MQAARTEPGDRNIKSSHQISRLSLARGTCSVDSGRTGLTTLPQRDEMLEAPRGGGSELGRHGLAVSKQLLKESPSKAQKYLPQNQRGSLKLLMSLGDRYQLLSVLMLDLTPLWSGNTDIIIIIPFNTLILTL